MVRPCSVVLLLVCGSALTGAVNPFEALQRLQQPAAQQASGGTAGRAPSVGSAVTAAANPLGGISSDSSSTEVLHLPGVKQGLPSRHFAGYVKVDDVTNRQLYYYLVTHEGTDESSDDSTPLIIWLTGGPGCSSMDAFTYEHGPFKFTAPGAEAAGREATLQDIQLNPNPFSWSKTAHVLYIDSPAGTGFSYTPGQKTYHTSDDKTIEDLEVFVEGFFETYSWLKKQPLYIAGESYGGVYVPLLMRALLQHNQRLKQQHQQLHHISRMSSQSAEHNRVLRESYNLAGYVVGNAVTDDIYDGVGQVEFAFGLGLIDPETYHNVKQTCKANGWHISSHSPCTEALERMEATMGPVNHYDILGRCFKPADNHLPLGGAEAAASGQTNNLPSRPRSQVDYHLLRSARRLQQQRQALQSFTVGGSNEASSSVGAGRLLAAKQLRHAISCADRRYASVYYNTEEVRQALHAAGLQETGRWEPCSDVLSYTQTAGSMIHVHQELMDAGLKGLVLSGDHDYVVPYTGTRAWVYDMRLQQAKPWHSWSLPGDDQVAGYAVDFKAGLTFASVKGGGHMVPQTHPEAALALLKLWLAGDL